MEAERDHGDDLMLKPCPFCGEEPKVIEGGTESDQAPWIRIACRNNSCFIKPSTEEFDLTQWEERVGHYAVDPLPEAHVKWNARVQEPS